MNNNMEEKFLTNLVGVGDRIRDLCVARFPRKIASFTSSQLRMIKCIFELTRHQREGIQLKTLAKVLAITPAATSEMVENLVRRGALERRVDARDRRAMALRLTPDLEEHFIQSEKYVDALIEKFFSTCEPEERRVAADIVFKLNEFLGEIDLQEGTK